MTQQEIKQTISGIAQLLGSNPEMMRQQLGMLKGNLRKLQKTENQKFSMGKFDFFDFKYCKTRFAENFLSHKPPLFGQKLANLVFEAAFPVCHTAIFNTNNRSKL